MMSSMIRPVTISEKVRFIANGYSEVRKGQLSAAVLLNVATGCVVSNIKDNTLDATLGFKASSVATLAGSWMVTVLSTWVQLLQQLQRRLMRILFQLWSLWPPT